MLSGVQGTGGGAAQAVKGCRDGRRGYTSCGGHWNDIYLVSIGNGKVTLYTLQNMALFGAYLLIITIFRLPLLS